jgi:hypothetical protein
MNHAERERLLQIDLPKTLIPRNPLEFVTVYELGELPDDIAIFSALIPDHQVPIILEKADWDLHYGNGQPYFEHDGQRVTSYQRISSEEGIEPLIHDRDYHNRWRSNPEVSEEFRLFHNLYQDSDGNLWKLDHNYEEVLVGKVESRKIQIQVYLIRQYLAVRGMHLVIFYASNRRSTISLLDMGFKAEHREVERDDRACAHLIVKEGWDAATFSRKLGKAVLAPFQQNHDSIRQFYDGPEKSYEDFVIGVDEQGKEVRHTCYEAELDNYFGANPGAPNYMTPVRFNSSVLDRYYNEPSKFEVVDGLVRCYGLWSHQIDNHNSDGVLCALGDLGKLPPKEQAHWKAHNTPPLGGWSNTTMRRWFDAEFAESARIEDDFRLAYENLRDVSTRVLGWSILKPLHEDDRHRWTSIHVPTKNEQQEFDSVITSLVVVVVESINTKEMKKLIPKDYNATLDKDALTGSLKVLDHVMLSHKVEGAGSHVSILRSLQAYRSKAGAHKRGSDWRQALEDICPNGRSLREVAELQIRNVINVLSFLTDWVQNSKPAT